MTEQEIGDKLSCIMANLTVLTPPERQYLDDLHTAKVMPCDGQINIIRDTKTKLDFIGLALAYIQFDLEATRRENTYLRRVLEESTQEDN